ncbi:MAG TPA: FtsX-like permease family protein [Cyclobacteriaceae bacterium]|nr:FtsX-like permease family protein [Cyclobacteriaceae bacterium]
MIRNYLRVAFRSLLKNKSYVIINTLGLGVSLACCITSYLLLAYNIEFDNFHDAGKVSRIFRFHTLSRDKDGKVVRDDQAPIILPGIAAEEIAGIGRYTRFLYGGGSMRYGDKAFNEGIAYADSTFFDLFDYPLAAGSYKSFKDKKSIFISEKLAKKYFGDEDPVGKMLVMNFVNNTEIEVLVGGVVKKFPINNTFTFEAMMRIENFMDIEKIKMDDWSDWRNPATFFELSSPENAASISAQFSKYIANRNKLRTDVVVESYQLVPFKSKFTQDDLRYGYTNRRISVVPLVIFVSMAALILLIACFNLTNTSIAMTSRRLKEVGVRKAVGAGRRQIASQFLLETLITIILSLLVGLLMAQVIVPAFYTMWRLPYGLEDLNGVNLFIALIVLVFLAALLAGIYPALFSSKFKPTMLLKGDVKIKGTNFLTRMLVASQFALSVIVLIAGVVFIQNSSYQEKIKFGYDKEMIVTVSLQGESDFKAMEAAIAGNPKILSVGVSDGNIGSNTYQTPVRIDTSQYDVQALGVGKNYMETMGLRLSEGRTFNLDNASDQEEGIVVNKAFVEKTGLKDPLDKIVFLHNAKHRILGVIENHVDNLYRSKQYEPFVFYAAGKNQYITLLVKTERGDLAEMQKYLQTTWKELFPNKPFESQFQEDLVFKGSKETNANLEKIFLFITILGGLLSASGIFALASLNIAKRTKEIGIRKALGATVTNIVGLLNREFVIILSIAAVLGSVGGYFLTGMLLGELYAYHIPVGIVSVILCAILIFIIGIFTTSSTILRAARANPVESLRTE